MVHLYIMFLVQPLGRNSWNLCNQFPTINAFPISFTLKLTPFLRCNFHFYFTLRDDYLIETGQLH